MLLVDPAPPMTCEVRLPVPSGEYEMVYELPLAATLVETTALAEAVMVFAEEAADDDDDAPAGLKTDADAEADVMDDADADADGMVDADAEADEMTDAEFDFRPEPAEADEVELMDQPVGREGPPE
jgi:hypothetical protein